LVYTFSNKPWPIDKKQAQKSHFMQYYQGLRERAVAIQGELVISSAIGKGTRVHLIKPSEQLSHSTQAL
jgi:nitrate/nitrite-specific signal transduction histidine kinase